MITPEVIEVSITYGQKITFFLKMIGIAEEAEIRARELGLSEKDLAEKRYDMDVRILKDLSAEKPVGLFPERNPKTKEVRTAAEMIDAFFMDRTPTKERIAYYAVRGYYVRLLPAESFF